MEFTAFLGELTPEQVLTSFTVRQLLGSESRSCIEYLMPSNNIVLHSYFNLTNKYNLIDRL